MATVSNSQPSLQDAFKRFLASPDGKIIMSYLWNTAKKNGLYKADTITADAAIYKVAVIELLLEIERLGEPTNGA